MADCQLATERLPPDASVGPNDNMPEYRDLAWTCQAYA